MSQRWMKRLSWISVIVIVSLMGATLLPGYSDAYAADKAKKELFNSRQEVVELRTENSKTFIKGDGKTYIQEEYLEPVHYQEDGAWKEIDNQVVAVSGTKALDPELPYINKANKFRIGFAKQSKSKKLVRFQLGKAKVDFHLIDGANVPAQTKNNKVSYKGIYPETDLVYHTDNSGVKEEWILHKYNGKSTFTMGMNVQHAKPVPQKDGSIQFVDSKGKALFTIPRPVMVDAKDSISHDVKLELRTEGNKTYLDVKADEEWLKDPKRAYPVAIDPSLTIQGTNDTYDAFVGNKDTTVQGTNYGSLTYLITGTYTDYGITRSFIKFQLQPLLSGAQISSARLYLNQYSTVANQQVNLYPVTSNWSSSSVTWNNQPSIGSLLSSTTVGGAGEYSWDLTSLARGWYSGTTKNYGVSLRHQTETNDRKSFRSSDYATDPTQKPKLVITYTISPLGEEPFWTSAATNVNTYNGNFYLPESDLNIPGRGIPASVSRAYNSRANTSGLFGYGWTSNIEQHLYDSGDGPIQYKDADGTLHSFTPNGDGTYDTSQVLQLELKKNADGTYTLTDASQNQYIFTTTGYIWKMIDPNENTTTINYSGALPIRITDASNRISTITYDANNRISRITDPASRTIEYSYNASGDLISVTKKDAAGTSLSTVTYEYETNHNLKGFTDPNGNKKTVTYTADDKVQTLAYPITVGGSVQTATTTFAYDTVNKLTTVTDPKGTKTLYTHNDYGNVVQITQDPAGLNYKQTFTYNNENQLVSQKDANANAANSSATYNYTYDANGNLTKVTNPLNETTTTTYDENNNPIKETDANGNTTTNEYDDKTNQTSTTDPAEKSSATKYDAYGNVIEETSAMSPGSNLANNGSFELDRNADNWPDDWETKAGTATFSWASPGLTTDGVTLGSRSVKISNPQTSAAVGGKLIPYNPAKTYVFSGNVKTVNANGQGTIYVFGYKDGVYQNIAYRSASITGNQDSTRLHVVIHPGDFPAGINQLQIRAYVSAGGKIGDYYFDGLQVEEEFNGAYNVLENGDLERDSDPADNIPDRWLADGSMEISTGVDGIDTTEKHAGNHSFRIVGKSALWKSLRQDVKLSGGAGALLTVSGFSKVQNPNPNGGIYGYIIETYSGTTLQETFTFHFNKSRSHDWEHKTAQIKTTKAFDNIKVYYEYSQQSG
ncbi:DNRLRE domain-containing protein, partial [Lihuaxuella thermophila]